MIEVEKRFVVTEEEEKSLITRADFLGKTTMTDIYYDDNSYSLTKKDIWLRKRNGKFELKIPMNKAIEERVSDQYEELESEEAILHYFNVSAEKTMADFMQEKGYQPFCKITTKRKKYTKEGFNIDVDETDYGYTCVEIESMVTEPSKMDEATKSIIQFAEKHALVDDAGWGKVTEFLRRNDPIHLQALIDAKVIPLDAKV